MVSGRIRRSSSTTCFSISSKCFKPSSGFPRVWQPATPGEPVHEGGVIERQSRWRYVYRCQRHHSLNPCLLAEQSERVFRSAKAVARYYLKWDLNLPGDLDGWKVVR